MTFHIQNQLASGRLLFRYSVDFSRVIEYGVSLPGSSGTGIIIKIEGTSWYSTKVVNLENGRALQIVKDGTLHATTAAGGSVERLCLAYSDFRIKHCRSRAS
jgi:hypothetical protein